MANCEIAGGWQFAVPLVAAGVFKLKSARDAQKKFFWIVKINVILAIFLYHISNALFIYNILIY